MNLIFKVSQTMRQIDIPLWTHMGHKEWSEDGKTFTRCYTIASKFWDEFNANFVLLHFSSYRSIKIWHLYLKNVEKKAVRQCINIFCTLSEWTRNIQMIQCFVWIFKKLPNFIVWLPLLLEILGNMYITTVNQAVMS